jgi:hypothetical protein
VDSWSALAEVIRIHQDWQATIKLVERSRNIFDAVFAAQRDGKRRLEWWNHGCNRLAGVSFSWSLDSAERDIGSVELFGKGEMTCRACLPRFEMPSGFGRMSAENGAPSCLVFVVTCTFSFVFASLSDYWNESFEHILHISSCG